MEDSNVQPTGKVSHASARSTTGTASGDNVVQRLKHRIKEAQQLGFTIRREVLDGEEATWCILGKQKVLFLDLTQTASEQLKQLNETIDSYLAYQAATTTEKSNQAA